MMQPMKDDPNASAPKREEAIFGAALQLAPGERAGFVEKACGADSALRQRVEVLLQAHEQAGEFLEPTPPVAAPNRTMILSVPATEGPGDVIGRYKIREKLGEGGCGVVYVAEQSEPVRRRVALKVIKLGMDTRSVIARFEAERQALAMMDHPNIARVLDAGTTEKGRPYFVMELVRGIRITDYCDQNNLDTRQRLELFIKICHAVQHAHQKGVIHRDLKPSNILVTLHDGTPVPKVIDFGIAKATEGRLTALTVYTELNQFIGTPAYMSPEQAEMSGLDIDTRSDIYSLGVLLYELLTGKTPFDPQELLHLGLDQMRRTIREKEPLCPSTRLNTMVDADLTLVARRHSAEAPKLVHFISGDLDWIVMKALEKDRTRRFETASGLAVDVDRFLKNEPVEARPPSTLYRFQKLVRRNTGVFAAVGAVAAALVIGLGLSLYLFIQEKGALRRAVAAEKQEAALRQQAEAGLALEKTMHERDKIGEQLRDAGLLVSKGEFGKAEEVMKQVPPIPQSSILFNVLGVVRARNHNWEAAVSNYTKSIEVDPTNHEASHCLAPLLIYVGDFQAYNHHRERILRQFSGITDPEFAGQLALDCLITPPATADLAAISKMADTALEAGANGDSRFDSEFVKGLVEYREGHFAAAVEWLRKVAPQEEKPSRTVETCAVLSMAQHQLGQLEEARSTLAGGLQIADAKLKQLDGPDWNDQLTAHLLMREAKELIEGAPTATGQTK